VEQMEIETMIETNHKEPILTVVARKSSYAVIAKE
jgi:IS30 family transposase